MVYTHGQRHKWCGWVTPAPLTFPPGVLFYETQQEISYKRYITSHTSIQTQYTYAHNLVSQAFGSHVHFIIRRLLSRDNP